MLGEQNRLAVTYAGSGKSTTYYYNLPLDGVSGIEDIVSGGDSEIKVSGNTVIADGAIEIFNTCGVRVAAGVGSLDLDALAPGIYVARTASAAVKIAVK